MTKPSGFTGRAGRNGIADLDLPIRDDDTPHQPLDQLPLLLPGRLLKPVPHPAAELVDAQAQACNLGLAIHLGLQLPYLGFESLFGLIQITSAPPELFKPEHAGQISFREPLNLLLKMALAAPEHLPARLQFLGQPMSPMRPLQG